MLRDIHVLLDGLSGSRLQVVVLDRDGVREMLRADADLLRPGSPGGDVPHYFSRFPGLDGGPGESHKLVDGRGVLWPGGDFARGRLLLHVDRIEVPRYVPGHFEI